VKDSNFSSLVAWQNLRTVSLGFPPLVMLLRLCDFCSYFTFSPLLEVDLDDVWILLNLIDVYEN
jgi:hypothetical protein